MSPIRSGLVEIIREFLFAYERTRRVAERFRSGDLRFDEVKELVGGDEGSCLYRLKERCHALFRPAEGASGVRMRREALLDLAVGSLFHESMKFRENVYQREVYGPKVRALRSQSGGEANALFREFEKILSASLMRVEEALQEMEALLEQAREQLRALLRDHRDNGLVTRFLCEKPEAVARVFGVSLDVLLAEIHGDAATGYAVAARSALDSGFFAQGERTLAAALARDGAREDLRRLAAYARGMRAYLDGRYAEAVACVSAWLEAGPGPRETQHARLALAAVASVGQLVEEAEGSEIAEEAAALAARIQRIVPEPAASSEA